MFHVSILWGRAPEPDDEPKVYSFDTELELDAFLKGVEEASGWLDHTVVDLIRSGGVPTRQQSVGFQEVPCRRSRQH